MSSTYIIGDVHGNYNGLVESLQKMGWKENEDRLIFVGDLVDRGIANKKVVDFVAEHKDTVHVVLGNHERQHKKWFSIIESLPRIPLYANWPQGYSFVLRRESVSSGRVMKSTPCVVMKRNAKNF